MEFNEKLKQLRKKQKISQEELAAQLNVSRQAVSKWEGGQGYPETDKLLMISNIFGVSLDYLLKDSCDNGEYEQEAGYYVSREMVQGYLEMKKRGSRYIATGVAVMVLSISFTMLFEDATGTFLFFLCIAVGIAILILQGFQHTGYEEVEKQPLVFDEGFIREFQYAYSSERKYYGRCIAAGVTTIVLSYPLNVLVEDVLGLSARYQALYPILWALGIALLIVNGSAVISGDVILKNREHIEELNQEKRFAWIFGVGFLLAASIFIMMGFVADKWHSGWIVFPITALLCSAISLWIKSKK